MNCRYFLQLTCALSLFICAATPAFSFDFINNNKPFINRNNILENKALETKVASKIDKAYTEAAAPQQKHAKPKEAEVHIDITADQLRYIIKFHCDGSIKSLDIVNLQNPSYYYVGFVYNADKTFTTYVFHDGFHGLYSAYFYNKDLSLRKVFIATQNYSMDCFLTSDRKLDTVYVFDIEDGGMFEYNAISDRVELRNSTWKVHQVRNIFLPHFLPTLANVVGDADNNYPWNPNDILKIIKDYGTPVTNPCQKSPDYIQKIVINPPAGK